MTKPSLNRFLAGLLVIAAVLVLLWMGAGRW